MDYFKYDAKSKTWFRTMAQWDPATKKMISNTFPLRDSSNVMGFDLLLNSEPKPDIVEFGIHEKREKYSWGEPKSEFRIVIQDSVKGTRNTYKFQSTDTDPLGRIAAQAFIKERYSSESEIGHKEFFPEDFVAW